MWAHLVKKLSLKIRLHLPVSSRSSQGSLELQTPRYCNPQRPRFKGPFCSIRALVQYELSVLATAPFSGIKVNIRVSGAGTNVLRLTGVRCSGVSRGCRRCLSGRKNMWVLSVRMGLLRIPWRPRPGVLRGLKKWLWCASGVSRGHTAIIQTHC